MKQLLQFLLKWLAKAVIARYNPKIVGVTGSVGKTGSRTAIVAVLGQRYRVFDSKKNLNNEIGLPLTILGESDSGYRNPIAWISILGRALGRLLFKNKSYPEVLVLEYGIDHPGDMDYLLSIARPSVAVVTAVSATHLEFLKTIDGVAKEKGKLIAALPTDGVAVLNYDFQLVASMKSRTKARIVGYGEAETADIKMFGVKISQAADNQIQGMSFRLTVGGSTVPVLIKNAVGKPVVSMAAAGAAVGYAMGLSALDITRGLENFITPTGRLKLIKGFNNSLIIDDTYNSSPQALIEAINVLDELPLASTTRRWAILGDMLELGTASEALHYDIGKAIASKKVDYLVTVGNQTKYLLAGARDAGMSAENSWHIDNIAEVSIRVKEKLQVGDIVLIKGSQGIRCEKIVKDLMAEPDRAPELLVRQSAPWV